MNYRHLLLLTLGFSLALQGTTLSEVEVIGNSPTATQEIPGFASIKNLFDLTYIASRNPEGIMPGNSRIIPLLRCPRV